MNILKKEGVSTISLNVVKTTFLFVTVPLTIEQKSHLALGAPKRKRRNARSGSHDTIAGPERN